jgi:hypothetical protein
MTINCPNCLGEFPTMESMFIHVTWCEEEAEYVPDGKDNGGNTNEGGLLH